MAGYSKTPLTQKLGLKPGMSVYFRNMPATVFEELSPLPEKITVAESLPSDVDFIHFFAESVADLAKNFPALKKSLAKSGLLWVSWRKGRRNTDLTENDVRALALKSGLVDVKVCAVDETWSGLKLVYRLKDR